MLGPRVDVTPLPLQLGRVVDHAAPGSLENPRDRVSGGLRRVSQIPQKACLFELRKLVGIRHAVDTIGITRDEREGRIDLGRRMCETR